MRARLAVFVLTTALLLRAQPAHAAAEPGGIVGYVVDQAGMPITGAKVVVTADAPARQRATYTNDEGFFRMSGLPAGVLAMVVTAPWFVAYRPPPFVLQPQTLEV